MPRLLKLLERLRRRPTTTAPSPSASPASADELYARMADADYELYGEAAESPPTPTNAPRK